MSTNSCPDSFSWLREEVLSISKTVSSSKYTSNLIQTVSLTMLVMEVARSTIHNSRHLFLRGAAAPRLVPTITLAVATELTAPITAFGQAVL